MKVTSHTAKQLISCTNATHLYSLPVSWIYPTYFIEVMSWSAPAFSGSGAICFVCPCERHCNKEDKNFCHHSKTQNPKLCQAKMSRAGFPGGPPCSGTTDFTLNSCIGKAERRERERPYCQLALDQSAFRPLLLKSAAF